MAVSAAQCLRLPGIQTDGRSEVSSMQNEASRVVHILKKLRDKVGDTISLQRVLLLLAVGEHDPDGVEQQRLIVELGMDRGAVSRSLAVLTAATGSHPALLRSEIDPAMRTRRIICLAPEGRSILEGVFSSEENSERECET